MAKVTIEESTLTAIGDAIRKKEGSTELVPTNDMPARIINLPSGGMGSGGLKSVNLTRADYQNFDISNYVKDKSKDFIFFTNINRSNGTVSVCYYPFENEVYYGQVLKNSSKGAQAIVSGGKNTFFTSGNTPAITYKNGKLTISPSYDFALNAVLVYAE